MSSKRDLHTLFIKHDTDFGTLSKKALSDLVFKIIFLQHHGTRIAHIRTELSLIIAGKISDQMILESLQTLEKNRKIVSKRSRYSIHPELLPELQTTANESLKLQERIFIKYLDGCETPLTTLKSWFQDSLIIFFENFSMEWFNHVSQNGKLAPKKLDQNITSAVEQSIIEYNGKILEVDKQWLKTNFIRFYESEEHDENLMFWNFGMSLFSSRLITARHYADRISIETFRNGTFLLDTNILMILDLEAHEYGKSFEALDHILNELNIKTKYLHITSEEYKRAILRRKNDTINVFESYNIDVLKTAKCPFVQTALARGCKDTEDVERMFEQLYNIPQSVFSKTVVEKVDYRELANEVETGQKDEDLKNIINAIHVKRFKKDKSENPKVHDAGLIYGAKFLRKTDKTWILTTDGTMKIYAIEHLVRDESELAIGLDVLIGMFAVNSGGVDVDSSNFAPLFKTLVKSSLMPEEHLFDVRDLAFILSTNLRINDLESGKVIEIANAVRRMRVSGQDDQDISLFLRREVEGQKITLANELGHARIAEGIAKVGKEKAERERDSAFDSIRESRKKVLRDKYDRQLLINRGMLLGIPLVITCIVFLVLKYGLQQDPGIQYGVSFTVEFICGVIPFLPINRRLIKRNSEYINGIDAEVEREILELKKAAKS